MELQTQRENQIQEAVQSMMSELGIDIGNASKCVLVGFELFKTFDAVNEAYLENPFSNDSNWTVPLAAEAILMGTQAYNHDQVIDGDHVVTEISQHIEQDVQSAEATFLAGDSSYYREKIRAITESTLEQNPSQISDQDACAYLSMIKGIESMRGLGFSSEIILQTTRMLADVLTLEHQVKIVYREFIESGQTQEETLESITSYQTLEEETQGIHRYSKEYFDIQRFILERNIENNAVNLVAHVATLYMLFLEKNEILEEINFNGSYQKIVDALGPKIQPLNRILQTFTRIADEVGDFFVDMAQDEPNMINLARENYGELLIEKLRDDLELLDIPDSTIPEELSVLLNGLHTQLTNIKTVVGKGSLTGTKKKLLEIDIATITSNNKLFMELREGYYAKLSELIATLQQDLILAITTQIENHDSAYFATEFLYRSIALTRISLFGLIQNDMESREGI